jgi:adenine-specific DNA-methyltransferase
MTRSSRSNDPKAVESLTHVADTRANIPTAEGSGPFYDAEIDRREPKPYPRNPDLDPQLVWRGKDEEDAEPLYVDAPPIYIQEKIDPRVLVENLRAEARASAPATDVVALWEDFDGLDGLDAIEYYQHEANWSNRMILGDSLQVMGSLVERESLSGKVQMVYIDPPYGIRFNSNWQVRASKRDVKDGRVEDSAREAEQIKAFRDTWSDGIHTYLSYLRDRLIVTRELLTESGSVFVQIGDENVHVVRNVLDEVFGPQNLVSQISFDKTSSSSMDYLDGVSDYLLWYAKDYKLLKYNPLYTLKQDKTLRFLQLEDGSRRPATRDERSGVVEPPKGSRWYEVGDITSQTDSTQARYTVEFDGQNFPVGKRNWATPLPGMTKAIQARRVERRASSIGFVRFADDFPAVPLRNNWSDTGTGSFTDDKVYVVQTGTKILQRAILMSTDPGDLVLDPTCGSGTTAFVAEQWGRRWITIDTSRVALALARQRLMGARYPFYVLADSPEGLKLLRRPDSPTRGNIHRGFVNERVQRITLKSIANNPDIRPGMTNEQVEAAIKRFAEFEELLDRPHIDSKKVRVSGRFTFESLSPHRSLSFETTTPGSEPEGSLSFEQSILDNLQKSGIQNGSKAGRFTFATLEPYAGTWIQAVGERRSADPEDMGDTRRVAVAIGPQYGTVSAALVKEALREATAVDPAVEVLYVLGFAFDPNVEGDRQFGRMRVEVVRMNVDLLMLGALKKTGAGNLFTVFGEPDIDVRTVADEKVQVEIRGVDVFNPNTGDVRSSTPDQIALWMIDTRYDDEAFFVRHAYFTGENDPYKNLKTALRAEIDEEVWATLRRHVSMPFERPETGKIAVKVINDYGDEVMKVFNI